MEADPETGRPCVANHAVFYGASKFQDTDLAYAVTGHNGMGGTVARGLAFITGSESLEWLYVALTRGRNRNTAITVTRDGVRDNTGQKVAIQPRGAEPQPGTRPDQNSHGMSECNANAPGCRPNPPGKLGTNASRSRYSLTAWTAKNAKKAPASTGAANWLTPTT